MFYIIVGKNEKYIIKIKYPQKSLLFTKIIVDKWIKYIIYCE